MDPSPSTETLSVVLRSQAQTIENQQQTIQQQQSTIEILSGAQQKGAAMRLALRELWENYLRTVPDVRWKQSEISTMKRFIAMHGDVRVGDFGPLHWESYRDAPAIKGHYCVTTRNLQLKRWKIVFNWAVDSGQLSQNPIGRVKIERPKPRRRTEISMDDEKKMLADLNPLMRAVFVTAIDSGMRRDEIRLLRWDEIDFKARTVFLSEHRTKTKRARTAHLTSRATRLLRGIPRIDGSPYVFANPDTKRPYSPNYFLVRFRSAVDSNGIRPAPGDGAVRFHDLRRSAGVRLIRLGAPIPAVQELLGHEHLAATALYVHANRSDVIQAHELLENATRKGPHRAAGRESENRIPVRRAQAR